MKTLSTIALGLLTGFTTQAQIVVDRTDFGNIDDMLLYANDTTLAGNFSIGTAGANVTWDFSTTVAANYYDSSVFIDPTTIPGAPEEANLAIIEGETPTFLNATNSGVKVIIPLGFLGGENAQVSIIKFPFTYTNGTTALRDSAKTNIQGTPEDFGFSGAPFDSMRISVAVRTASVIDGWGTLITPIKSYEALRVKNETNVDVSIQGKLPFIGTWVDVPIDGIDQQEVMYGWYAKDGMYNIANVTLDSNGNFATFRYQTDSIGPIITTGLATISKEVVSYMQPNPANEEITLSFNSNYAEKGTLIVFDITGKVLVNETINIVRNENALKVKTIDMNNGIYFARIISEHVNTSSKFVVKH